jgi:murein DD-endopeptidase MepM/ murein hydrolase activator NlpD
VKFLLIAGVLIVIGTPAALFFLSSPPAFEAVPTPRVLGPENTLAIQSSSPHGLRSLDVVLQQGTASSRASIEQPANRFLFWRHKAAPAKFDVKLAVKGADGFKSGPAKLTVTAVSNDLRAQAESRTYDVVANLEPLRLTVDGAQHYINQGGSEMVTFTVSGYFTESGVRVGKHEFRSFPMPGGKGPRERMCIFAFPWDTPTDAAPVVFARNPGQEVTGHFWYKLFPKKFRRRDLDLSDAFIEKVVSEIDPSGSGSTIDRFLKINGELRRQNNKTMAELANESEAKFLWSPPFQQLSNSKVEAQFADVRSYKYGGKQVDEQVHLGFDLSKVQHAPVVASNSGRVVWADRLGIYGNCVVVDHGYGLESIYGHLSEIAVKKGQMVKRGEELGKSGATGLAGGDHLHFSMQVDGVQVNPVEWWDPHWIHDRIESKLPQGALAGQ